MKWEKKGLIFTPKSNLKWMAKRTSLPFAEKIKGDLFKIYFYGQNIKNESQIGYFEINLNKPKEVIKFTEKPILKLGSLGSFDDSGVMPSWIVNKNNKKYLYYTGWSLGIKVPFYFFIGLAISNDGGNSFDRYSKSPILGRNEVDPYLTASPCLIVEENIWKMWYVSCIKWEMINNKPKHYYHIKYAESNDGINWKRNGKVSIDFKSEDEFALARPCVLLEDGVYKMWYSYRGKRYKIGYAESKNGIDWIRKDELAGITTSEFGWDSEMICYSFVFKNKEKMYMLYCGNNYGDTGIGYAISV